jgi:hypothetical protein
MEILNDNHPQKQIEAAAEALKNIKLKSCHQLSPVYEQNDGDSCDVQGFDMKSKQWSRHTLGPNPRPIRNKKKVVCECCVDGNHQRKTKRKIKI